MNGGFEVAFECSASPDAFLACQAALRRRGTLIVVSDGNAGHLMLGTAFHSGELRVFGSDSHPGLWRFAPSFFERSHDRYREVYDLRVEFEELPNLFERLASGETFRKPLVRYPIASRDE